MKKFIDKIRIGILVRLTSSYEKYMITRAINDRIDNLEKNCFNDYKEEIQEYKELKKIFFSKDWL